MLHAKSKKATQLTFFCSKSTLETPKGVKRSKLTKITPFFIMSVVDFEQVNANWEFFR